MSHHLPVQPAASHRGAIRSGNDRVRVLGADVREAVAVANRPRCRARSVAPRLLCACLVVTVLGNPLNAASVPTGKSPDATRRVKNSSHERFAVQGDFASMPLHFETNEGQAAEPVRYLARGQGYLLALMPDEVKLCLMARHPGRDETGRLERGSTDARPAVLTVRLMGGNPNPTVEALDPLPGRVNHFCGNDPAQWRTNIATFAKVRYREVYPGVDLVYYGQQQELEYDFVVSPQSDPALIRLSFEGAKEVTLDDSGDLVLRFDTGEVKHRRPVIWQEVQGQRHSVSGRFVKRGAFEVGFEVGEYDRSRPLVIDPVLEYASYFGSSAGDGAAGIAVDASGYAVVVGFTWSFDNFPFKNAYQDHTDPRIGGPGVAANGNAFVMRIAPDGTLVYATYLGGEEYDEAHAVAVDNASNAYVTGVTQSAPGFGGQGGFPTTQGAYKTTFPNFSTPFVSKFSAAGGLVYSTFLFTDLSGGAYEGNGIAVDSTGYAFVTGKYGGGGTAVFVVKVNPAGSTLVYTNITFNGIGYAIAVDSAGAAHVAGDTVSGFESTFFPTTPNAYETNHSDFQFRKPFYMKVAPDGQTRPYVTLIGSRNSGMARAVAVDGLGRAHIAGSIGPRPQANFFYGDFRPKNALQSVFGGGPTDAYIARFDPSQSGTNSLLYATYLGGSGDDRAASIAVDEISRMYVAGTTTSTNFPVVDALQTNHAGGTSDAFVAQLNAAGSGLLFSTYLGGDGNENANGVAVGLAGVNLYVAGTTGSTNFPVWNAVQPNLKGTGTDAFAVRIRLAAPSTSFTVNSTNDVDDGVCDTNHCSLREAIGASNRTPGKQTIQFNIPGSGIPEIRPTDALPVITDPVVVDGTTQPVGGLVELYGIEDSFADQGGLIIQAGQSEVHGLVITGWSRSGIYVVANGGNHIHGNFIGVRPGGSRVRNYGHGIIVVNSSGNLIGGSTPAERNVLSGNGGYGIWLAEGSNDNNIFGNIIGADAAGAAAIGNELGGVLVESYRNRIGAPAASPGAPPGNLISGNSVALAGIPVAIQIQGESAFANQIVGNLIGTRFNGETPLPNRMGIVIDGSPNNRVGGPDAASRNVISGNVEIGIMITGRRAQDNRIEGNFIGTDATGQWRVPNGAAGVVITEKTVLGGSSPQPGAPPGNVISGNDRSGVVINGSDNRLEGNLIGLNHGGTFALHNAREGVFIDAASAPAYANVIGGRTAGVRNVIAGNARDGILVEGPRAASTQVDLKNRIEGNLIGVTTGGVSVPNQFSGVAIVDASGNVVGGDAPEAANRIAFNLRAGVRIGGEFGTRNTVARNSIDGNGLLGIDLGFEGVTPNDPRDEDAGANLLQNFPASLRAVDFGDSIAVRGRLESQPRRAYRVEFFETAACDSSGHGQGGTFLGTQIVTLDESGSEQFFSMLPRPPLAGDITATATDPEGNTSEFSPCADLKPAIDVDSDGSHDFFEDGAPNNGDGNNDGTPDRQQPNVGSAFSWTAQEYITGVVVAGHSLKNFGTPTSLPGELAFSMKVQFPFDRLRFEVLTPQNANGPRPQGPGDAVQVTIYSPPGSPVNSYYMFGPTPANTTPHWYEFTFDGTTGAVFGTNTVTLHFIDGQRGDHDLAANGIIVSAGGLAVAANILLRIADFAPLPLGQFFLRVSGEAGRTFAVQSSTNLTAWTTAGTTNSASGIFDYVDTPTVPADERFYRVVQQP